MIVGLGPSFFPLRGPSPLGTQFTATDDHDQTKLPHFSPIFHLYEYFHCFLSLGFSVPPKPSGLWPLLPQIFSLEAMVFFPPPSSPFIFLMWLGWPGFRPLSTPRPFKRIYLSSFFLILLKTRPGIRGVSFPPPFVRSLYLNDESLRASPKRFICARIPRVGGKTNGSSQQFCCFPEERGKRSQFGFREILFSFYSRRPG